MRIVFGREGFLKSEGADRIRSRRPDWRLSEATGDSWRAALRDHDVAIPLTMPVTASDAAVATVRLVQQFGTGLDTVDIEACRTAGIAVAHVPSGESANAASVAEFAVLLVLALVRDLDAQRAAARSGATPMPASMVAGRRFVLLGLGGVGQAVATRLAPFGVELIGVRAHPEDGSVPGVLSVHGPDELPRLVAGADGVICCAPGGSQPIIDAASFRAMRRGSIVVNVARGAVLDERALLAALDDGTVAAAGLDVLDHEPPRPDDPLVRHPRVIVTPHIAGTTTQSVAGIADAVIDNVTRFERGQPVRWQVS